MPFQSDYQECLERGSVFLIERERGKYAPDKLCDRAWVKLYLKSSLLLGARDRSYLLETEIDGFLKYVSECEMALDIVYYEDLFVGEKV